MRARSKFGLGNPDEARADFVSLLRVNPNYALTGQISPRVVTLFDETAAQTVTNLAAEPHAGNGPRARGRRADCDRRSGARDRGRPRHYRRAARLSHGPAELHRQAGRDGGGEPDARTRLGGHLHPDVARRRRGDARWRQARPLAGRPRAAGDERRDRQGGRAAWFGVRADRGRRRRARLAHARSHTRLLRAREQQDRGRQPRTTTPSARSS